MRYYLQVDHPIFEIISFRRLSIQGYYLLQKQIFFVLKVVHFWTLFYSVNYPFLEIISFRRLSFFKTQEYDLRKLSYPEDCLFYKSFFKLICNISQKQTTKTQHQNSPLKNFHKSHLDGVKCKRRRSIKPHWINIAVRD